MSDQIKSTILWSGLGLAAGALGAALLKKHRCDRAARWRKVMSASPRPMALITGASSGIGAVFARHLASLGYNLVLVARRVNRLEELAVELHALSGVAVELLPADLSTLEGITQVEARIASRGDIDFLVNNAGYSTFGAFAAVPIEESIGLINCHTIAPVRLSRAALPQMLVRNRGAIVNVSSVSAFLPGDANYSPTKAYLVIFSQSLKMELAGTQVRVQALCPGFTRTEFHDREQFKAEKFKEKIPGLLWLTAESVVSESLKGLAEGQVVCIPSLRYRLIVAFLRLGLAEPMLDLAHFLT